MSGLSLTIKVAAPVFLLGACQVLVGVSDYKPSGDGPGGQGGAASVATTGATGGMGSTGGGGAGAGTSSGGGVPVCGPDWGTSMPLTSADVALAQLTGVGGNSVNMRVGGVAITESGKVALAVGRAGLLTGFTFSDGSAAAAPTPINGGTTPGRSCAVLQIDGSQLTLDAQWNTAIVRFDAMANYDCLPSDVVRDGDDFWVGGLANNTSMTDPGGVTYILSDEENLSWGGYALKFNTDDENVARALYGVGAGIEHIHGVAVVGNDTFIMGTCINEVCVEDSATKNDMICSNCSSGRSAFSSWHDSSAGFSMPDVLTDGLQSHVVGAAVAERGGKLISGANRGIASNGATASLAAFGRTGGTNSTALEAQSVTVYDVAISSLNSFATGIFTGPDLSADGVRHELSTPIGGASSFLLRATQDLTNPHVTLFSASDGPAEIHAMAAGDNFVAVGIHTKQAVTVTNSQGSWVLNPFDKEPTAAGAVLVVVQGDGSCVRHFWLGDGTTIDAIDILGSDIVVAGTFMSTVNLPNDKSLTGVDTNQNVYVGRIGQLDDL